MGMLVDGKWQAEDASGFVRDGQNVRFDSGFSGCISTDGSSEFAAEAGRYALYFNRTCPWSHRAAVTRQVKGLTEAIDVVLLEPAMGEQSWWFGDSGEYHDPAIGAKHLHELYSASKADFTGRVSVPILWDKQLGTIVSNDSGAIARMFNTQFDALATRPELDLYPSALRGDIDELNEFIADRINDGVYRCMLAKTQADYEVGFDRLFGALDSLDERLNNHRYLLANQPTEPDWRLFAALVRFDCVYYGLYNCNLRRIVDYPNLWDYTRDLYQLPGVAETVDIEKIKSGYFTMIGRGGIVPKGPILDFSAAHGRAARFP
jgi:glutathionyl-hydroquinone reductase